MNSSHQFFLCKKILPGVLAAIALSAVAAPNVRKSRAPDAATPTPPQVVPAPKPPLPVPALGPVASYAAQHGVRRCLNRIDQISNFMISGSNNSGAAVFLAPHEPDLGLVSISLEIQGSNGLSFVTSAFAPAAAGGCGGEYEAITYWAGNCEQVAASFPGFKLATPLRQHIFTLDGGPNAKIYLMPAGQGCISIKKEVVY